MKKVLFLPMILGILLSTAGYPAQAIERILQPGPGESKDIWTTSDFCYCPGGGGPGGGRDDHELVVGGWGDEYYTLIEFDLSGMPAQATSVRLELFPFTQRGSGTTGLYLDRITEFWNWRIQGTGSDMERLWWADRPSAVQWIPGSLPAPTVGQWYSIDITDLYNAWQNGTHPNHGLLLRPSPATNNRWNEFYSSDYTGDPSLRPRLVVEAAKQAPRSPTGLSVSVGNRTIFVFWDPPLEPVDQFLVRVEKFDGSTFASIGTFNVFNSGLLLTGIIFSDSFPNGTPIENGIGYRLTLIAERDGVQSPPSDAWFAVPGTILQSAVPGSVRPLLFLHGFGGSGSRDNGTFAATLNFLTHTLGWIDGGHLFHLEADTTTVTQNLNSNGDFFTVDFGNRLGDYPTLSPRSIGGLFHQGVEVAHFVSKLKNTGVQTPLTLVAHSNGGLAVQAFLLDPANTDPPVSTADVARLITYGTPHRGADVGKVSEALITCTTANIGLFGLVGSDLIVSALTTKQGAQDAAFSCDESNRLILSNFLQTINRQLPDHIEYASIVGHNHDWKWVTAICPALIFVTPLGERGLHNDCHEKHWDVLVPTSSAALDQAGLVSSQVPLITTDKRHDGQGNDFPAILCALNPSCLQINVMSPVEIGFPIVIAKF